MRQRVPIFHIAAIGQHLHHILFLIADLENPVAIPGIGKPQQHLHIVTALQPRKAGVDILGLNGGQRRALGRVLRLLPNIRKAAGRAEAAAPILGTPIP